jgi:hypothetical protein
MFRVILYMLLAVVLISVLRSIIGVLTKTAAALFSTPSKPGPSPPSAQLGGDLHRDPVCGTFVAETTAFQRRVSGQTFYYCSDSCKDKHSLVAR